jgi:hypothetical protein
LDLSKKKFITDETSFINNLPPEDKYNSYNKDFTFSEDFMRGLKLGSPLDNIYNMFVNEQEFLEDKNYHPDNDFRIKQSPHLKQFTYMSRSFDETSNILNKLDTELKDADLLKNGNFGGFLGNITGLTILDPTFYLSLGAIKAASKATSAIGRYGQGFSYAVGANIPGEGIKAIDMTSYQGDQLAGNLAMMGAMSSILSRIYKPLPPRKLNNVPFEEVKSISNRKNIVHEESFETPGSVGAKLNEETLNTGPYRNFRNGKYNVHEELREEAIKTTGTKLENIPWNPALRLLQSNNVVSRSVADQIVDISGILRNKHFEGKASLHSAEIQFGIEYISPLRDVVYKAESEFVKYSGLKPGDGLSGNIKPLIKSSWQNFKGVKEIMQHSQFREQITMAMRNGDRHDNPHVLNAAKHYRGLYDKIKQDAMDADIFGKAYQKQIINLEIRLNSLKNNKLKIKEANAIKQQIKDLNDKIEFLRTKGPMSANGVGYVPRIWDHGAIENNRAGARSTIANALLINDPKLSLKQALDYADESIISILKEKPYIEIDADDILIDASATKQRILDIKDVLVSDYLVNDIGLLTRNYVKQMGTDITLTNRFGDITLKEVKDEIRNAHKQRINNVTDKTKLKILEKELKNDLRDIDGLRDRLRGTYGAPKDPHRFVSRSARGLKSLSVITMMGGATLSSIPDIGIMVMNHGLKPTFDALHSLWFKKGHKIIEKMNRKEAQYAAEALEMELNYRALSMADVGDIFGNRFGWERSLHNATNIFMFMNGLNIYNTIMKETTGLLVSNNISREALKVATSNTGYKLTKKNQARLNAVGLDSVMLERIGKQVKIHYEDVDGFIMPNTDKWTDSAAVTAFRAALKMDINKTIITPGAGDRALWTSTEWGSVVAQYQSFNQAFVNKVLYRGLQETDMAFAIGVVTMMSLGILVEELKRKQYGQKPIQNNTERLIAGFSRSGLGGWFTHVGGSIATLTDNKLSMSNLLGQPIRDTSLAHKFTTVGGPTATQLNNLKRLVSSGVEGNFNSNAAISLTPGQSLPGVRNILED